MKQGLQLCKSVLAIHKDEIVIPFILKRHKSGLEENRPRNEVLFAFGLSVISQLYPLEI